MGDLKLYKMSNLKFHFECVLLRLFISVSRVQILEFVKSISTLDWFPFILINIYRGTEEPILTRFVNCVSIIKLCTCFSARLNSNFRDTTATSRAVQPAPCEWQNSNSKSFHIQISGSKIKRKNHIRMHKFKRSNIASLFRCSCAEIQEVNRFRNRICRSFFFWCDLLWFCIACEFDWMSNMNVYIVAKLPFIFDQNIQMSAKCWNFLDISILCVPHIGERYFVKVKAFSPNRNEFCGMQFFVRQKIKTISCSNSSCHSNVIIGWTRQMRRFFLFIINKKVYKK